MLDIFSKKRTRKKQEEPLLIEIDHREQNSLVVSELKEKGFEIEMKQLPVADYIIKGIAIERKTVSDFISSMINKRLIRQLEELQQYKKKLLLIEGTEEQELYNDEPEGINGNAIRGFLLSILLEYNVPVVFTKDSEDTAKFLHVLAKKKQKNHISIRAAKRNLNKKEQMQFILEGFPGIGPAAAKKLLKKFKTLKNIFNAPHEELQNILGKKAEIFQFLDKKY